MFQNFLLFWSSCNCRHVWRFNIFEILWLIIELREGEKLNAYIYQGVMASIKLSVSNVNLQYCVLTKSMNVGKNNKELNVWRRTTKVPKPQSFTMRMRSEWIVARNDDNRWEISLFSAYDWFYGLAYETQEEELLRNHLANICGGVCYLRNSGYYRSTVSAICAAYTSRSV